MSAPGDSPFEGTHVHAGAPGAHAPPVIAGGYRAAARSSAVDGAPEGFRQKEKSPDGRPPCHDDGIPEAVVDIAGRRHHGERGGRKEASEPAVADVIRQR